MALTAGQRWITVHPHGEDDEGRPVLINGDGTIAAGMGGKFNGQHIAKAFGGGKDSAGVVHGGDAQPDGYKGELPDGALPEHNKHLDVYGGMKDIADVTVHGTPEGDADNGYVAHLKGAQHLVRMIHEGQHTTQGGAFLAKHPDGGALYYGSPQPGEHYNDFAKRMSEDVLNHALQDEDSEPAQEHEDQTANSAMYLEEYEREQRENYRRQQKLIRDTIRGEGGIRAHKKKQTDKHDPRHGDEYRYLPSWAKNNHPDSPTLDVMAERLSHSLPQLGISSEDDLREYLMRHNEWLQADKKQKQLDDEAFRRTRGEQKNAAKQSKTEQAAAKTAAKADAAQRSQVIRDKTNGDDQKASHYLMDHPDDVAELQARHPTFDPAIHHAIRPLRPSGMADVALPVAKAEVNAKTEPAPKEKLPAYVKKALKEKNKVHVKESATMDSETTNDAAGYVKVRESVAARDGSLPRIPVVFMTAGPGNAAHGNTYKPAAIEALVGEIKRQPKMYISHPDDEVVRRVGHRPLQDLGGIAVRESVHYDRALGAAVGDVIPTPTFQAYVDVARAAGDDIGVSVNGIGRCEPGTKNVVGWTRYFSSDFVPQGGAGGYTRLVREAETPAYSPEEQKELDMELLKTLTLAELKAANPELYAAVVKEAAALAPAAAPADAVTKEQYEAVVKENAGLAERLTKLEAENTAIKVREAQREAADLVTTTLAEKPLTEAQRAFVAKQFKATAISADGAYKDADALATAVREAADDYLTTLPKVSGQIIGLGGAAPAGGTAAPVRESAAGAETAFGGELTDWIGEGYFGRTPAAPKAETPATA